MKKLVAAALILAPIGVAEPAFSQTAVPTFAGYREPCFQITLTGGGVCARATVVTDATGSLIVSREAFQLAAANVAAAPVTVYGGSYIFTQTCTTYGSDAFQVLGPDGTTYQTVATYTTTDATGGHSAILGSYAKVRVVLTGTAGCNATLTRVP